MPLLFSNIRLIAVATLLTASLFTPAVLADPDEDAAERAYYSGNGFLNRGMYDLAADEYSKFLDANPRHEKADVARYGLAVALIRLNKPADAAEPLEALYEKDDFTYAAEVALMLGQCRMAAEQYAPAAEAFERVCKRHASHALAADAMAQLVEAYDRAREYKKAVEFGERMLKQYPKAAPADRAAYFAGLAAMQLGESAVAVRQFAHLLDTVPNSPFALHATLLLAQLREQAGELDTASEHYRVVVAAGDNTYRPHAQLGLAHVLMRQGKPDEAAEILKTLAESKPSSPLMEAVQLALGRLHFDAGRYEPAERAFRMAAGAPNPKKSEAAYWTAKCLLRRGETKLAAEALDDVDIDALAPDDRPLLHYDRAVARLRCGDKDEARLLFESFRKTYPKHALAAGSLYWLAAIAHEQGEYADCLAMAARFLDAYADDTLAPKAIFLVAESSFLTQRYDDAAKAYQTSLDKQADAPNAAVARYRLGLSLYHLGRLADARPLLEQCGENDDADGPFAQKHLVLGDICFQSGEWAAAVEHLQEYIELGTTRPAADDALLKLGIALHRLDRDEEAIKFYQRLLNEFAKSPHRAHAMFEHGQSLVALKRFDEAKRLFDGVANEADAARFAPAVQRHLASIALQLGDSAEAARQFHELAKTASTDDEKADATYEEGRARYAAGDYDATEKALGRFLKHHATHAHANDARATRCMALARLKRHQDALDLMKLVDTAELAPPERAALKYEKAWCLRSLRQIDAAADVYRDMLKADAAGTLLPNVLLELAEIESAAGRLAEAVSLLQRIVSINGDAAQNVAPQILEQAQYRLGTSLFQQKQYDEAAAVLTSFIASNAEHELADSAAYFCGESLFELGRKTEAIPHFERASAKPHGDARGPSLLRLGECYAAGQYWPKSEETFAAYLKELPDAEPWFQAQFGIGWARENQGRHNEAIEAYRAVVDRHKGPTAARAQFQIGQCLFAAKQYGEAARELVKVDILYAYPEWSAAALYEAGRCFEKLAKLVEARHQYTRVIENYKETRWAQLAEKQLAALPQSDLPGRN